MREIMKRLKLKKEGESFDDAIGLGFDKTKVEIKGKPTLNKDGISRLDGINELVDEEEKEK